MIRGDRGREEVIIGYRRRDRYVERGDLSLFDDRHIGSVWGEERGVIGWR